MKQETMTKSVKLPFGSDVEVSITLKIKDYNYKDQEKVWGFFKECSDTFCLCKIPCIVGEMKGGVVTAADHY